MTCPLRHMPVYNVWWGFFYKKAYFHTLHAFDLKEVVHDLFFKSHTVVKKYLTVLKRKKGKKGKRKKIIKESNCIIGMKMIKIVSILRQKGKKIFSFYLYWEAWRKQLPNSSIRWSAPSSSTTSWQGRTSWVYTREKLPTRTSRQIGHLVSTCFHSLQVLLLSFPFLKVLFHFMWQVNLLLFTCSQLPVFWGCWKWSYTILAYSCNCYLNLL